MICRLVQRLASLRGVECYERFVMTRRERAIPFVLLRSISI
jgi:hypothetical protein